MAPPSGGSFFSFLIGRLAMQFVLILAVLGALVVSESGPSQPVAGTGYRFGLSVLGMMAVALFAVVSSALVARRMRQDTDRRPAMLRTFKQLRRVHVVLWLAVAGGIFFGLDWARLVRFNWHLDRAFLLDDLLILTPVLLPMVLSWAAFYEVDLALCSRPDGLPEADSSCGTRRQYLALHMRHYLGVLLLPVLLLLAVQDGAELLVPGVLEGQYGPVIYGPAVVAIFLFFPNLLRYVWRTEPLGDGPLRRRLEAVSLAAKFRARDILVWRTGQMVANAAVAGLVGPLRYVFLTDGLLRRLTADEIEAVFGHEVGHIRHRHLPLRLAAMLAPLSIWIGVECLFPQFVAGAADWLHQGPAAAHMPLGLLGLAGAGAYLWTVFGFYSRQLEYQADLFGCRLVTTESRFQAAATLISALEKLAAAGGVDRKARGWQHASIARRADFLRRVALDEQVGVRFHRRIRLLNGLVILSLLGPILLAALIG